MGYSLFNAKPDLPWYYESVIRLMDNNAYCANILYYVDDILCIHHDVMVLLEPHHMGMLKVHPYPRYAQSS
jgi:hypothetical protein